MDNEIYESINDIISVDCPKHGIFRVRLNNHIINKRGNAPSKLIQCNNCRHRGKVCSAESQLIMQTLNSLGMNIYHGSSAVPEYVLPNVENKYNTTKTSVDGIDFTRNIVFEFHGSPFHGWEFYGRYYLRGFFGCSSVMRLKRTYEKELAILCSGYKLCVSHGIDLAEANRMLGSDMPFRMLDPNIYMSGIIEPIEDNPVSKIGFFKKPPQ
jgi:hypothetical protein